MSNLQCGQVIYQDKLSIMCLFVNLRFTSGNFLKASHIIRAIKKTLPEREDRRPVFWSDEERVLTYELAISILKYSSFLLEALQKCEFYSKFPHLREAGQEELLVILYDLVERDFRVSSEDTPLPEVFSKLQEAIISMKTKIMAHIAKLRIKHEATTLEKLLPTNLRQRQNIDKNPLYFWINLKKTGMTQVANLLRSQGLRETQFEDDTLIQEHLFSVNKLHPDLVRVHSSKATIISNMPMFRDGHIVVQDKSACLPVYTLAKALYFREALNHRGAGMENLNPFPNLDPAEPASPPEVHSTESQTEEWYQGILDGSGKNFSRPDCVVVTHCGAGRTPAHLAMILAEAVPQYLSKSGNMSTSGSNLAKAIKSKFYFRPPLNVIVFGTPENKHDEIAKYAKRTLGVANIRLYSDDFLGVHPKDSRIRGCGAILVNPPSSGSALKDPVSYICSEGGDEQVLAQFSQFASSTTTIKVKNEDAPHSEAQARYLSHALRMPNVKLIMYTTCSTLASENGEVVRYCVNEARRREETRKCQLYASIVLQSQSRLYRDVSFEVVNMERLMDGYEKETVVKDDFVEMMPSSACSGVFMALIRRRDKQVSLAKNPVKQFVASQIKVRSEDNDDLDDFLSVSASGSPSSSNLADYITQEELARYLIRKLNLDQNEVKTTRSPGISSSATVVPTFQAIMKKKSSKKAIVKRVSTPTHSSLQRQSEKYERSSNPNSGTQTPRSGVSTPVTPLADASRPSTSVPLSAPPSARSQPRPTTAACQHHHGHGHVCVCARHAKKFPDLLKNL